MNVKLNPYLNFKGKAKEAMTFYESIFGGKLTMTTFGQSGVPGENADGIMHSELITENGMTIMGSDTPDHMTFMQGTNVNLSLTGNDEALLKGYWDKLSVNATIAQPLEKAPWGDIFGMLKDQFGINWLVNIAAKK